MTEYIMLSEFEPVYEALCNKHGVGGARVRFFAHGIWKGVYGQEKIVHRTFENLLPVLREGAITSFRGEYDWLSNFYEAPITWQDKDWPTSEHAYQASKTVDPDEQEEIRLLETPGRAKRAGRKVTQRSDWAAVKRDFMYEISLAKYNQNPDLKQKLLATGNRLIVEGNTWGDTYWGCSGGTGMNHLGRILMRIRDELRKTP